MSLAVLSPLAPRPALAPLAGFHAAESRDLDALAALTGRARAELAERFAAGHRAHVAWLDGVPAAFGWVATRTARLGELDATLRLAPDERYLWNFVTVPAMRGRGVYPRLLDAILAGLAAEGVRRAWIAYAPENHASAAGIRKAGFVPVADLSFDHAGRPAFRARGAAARAVAALLDVGASAEELAPCWRCARKGRACAPGSCTCDYQRPESGCAGGATAGSSSSNGAGIS